MTATSQPTTFADLYTDLMQRVRADTSAAIQITQAQRYINIGLQDMHIGVHNKVPWAERKGFIQTRPAYTTGTLTLLLGSATVSATDTGMTSADAFGIANVRAGGKVQIAGRTEIYTVVSVTGELVGSLLTLDTPWQGESASGVSYTYFEDDFALAADFMRPENVINFSRDADIELIGRDRFRRLTRNNVTFGVPTHAMVYDAAPSGNVDRRRRVVFTNVPNERFVIPYWYVTQDLVVSAAGAAQYSFEADTDEPIVPLRYRHAIVLDGLWHWYRDRKDDRRHVPAKAEYDEKMALIASEHEVGDDRPQLLTRVGRYRSRARRPYRRGGLGARRYTTGGAFDRLE